MANNDFMFDGIMDIIHDAVSNAPKLAKIAQIKSAKQGLIETGLVLRDVGEVLYYKRLKEMASELEIKIKKLEDER
jgi:hypothetical protein